MSNPARRMEYIVVAVSGSRPPGDTPSCAGPDDGFCPLGRFPEPWSPLGGGALFVFAFNMVYSLK